MEIRHILFSMLNFCVNLISCVVCLLLFDYGLCFSGVLVRSRRKKVLAEVLRQLGTLPRDRQRKPRRGDTSIDLLLPLPLPPHSEVAMTTREIATMVEAIVPARQPKSHHPRPLSESERKVRVGVAVKGRGLTWTKVKQEVIAAQVQRRMTQIRAMTEPTFCEEH